MQARGQVGERVETVCLEKESAFLIITKSKTSA